MTITWKSVDAAEHAKLPSKAKSAGKDPEWEAALDELQAGRAVMLNFADEKERGALSRSVGRRASQRGFKVEIRRGDNFISVLKTGDTELELPAIGDDDGMTAETAIKAPTGRRRRASTASE